MHDFDIQSTLRSSREAGPFSFIQASYPASIEISRHAHSEASVALVLAGRYAEKIGARERDCWPGLAVTHPAGEGHSNRHGNSRVQLLIVSLSNQPGALLDDLKCVATPMELETNDIARQAAAIQTELGCTDKASELALTGLTFELLAALERPIPVYRGRHHWVSRIAELLREEPQSHHSLLQLATFAGVHPAHLSKAFRIQFGTSVGAYARRARLEWARRALLSGDRELAAIAADAGFADQSHFGRCFQRCFGVPPGRWRTTTRRGFKQGPS